MSARRTDPEWRAFERLVARIEADAREADVIVTSPDHIHCRITGALREVDASIRRMSGGTDSLITIECRKRRGRQDVTWIEQLATKRQSIGADRTIAVSASGFSSAAHRVAAVHGIELKAVSEVSVVDINPAAKLDLVWFWHRVARLLPVGLRYFEAHDAALIISGDVDGTLPAETDPFLPIFTNVDEDHSWSINDIWHQLQAVLDPFAGIAKGDPPVIRTALFPYPGNVRVETPHGPKMLGHVLLSVALSIEVEPVDLEDATRVRYGDDEAAVQRMEFASKRSAAHEWRVDIQLPANAADLTDLKVGGTWPQPDPGDR